MGDRGGYATEPYRTPTTLGHTTRHRVKADAEFKTLVIRMLQKLREDLSSVKKTQSETKDTLTEI